MLSGSKTTLCWSACARCLARSNSVSTAGVHTRTCVHISHATAHLCRISSGLSHAPVPFGLTGYLLCKVCSKVLSIPCSTLIHPYVANLLLCRQPAGYAPAVPGPGSAGEQLDLERTCVMASLTRLPGARGVSVDCIAALLAHGLNSGCRESVLPLIHLPAAKRISSGALCRLLLACTAQRRLEYLFPQLSRCVGRTP